MKVSEAEHSTAKRCSTSDNDNDNDTLREVPHRSNEGLALQARVSGPWPHKKRICLTGEACSLARCASTNCCGQSVVHRVEG